MAQELEWSKRGRLERIYPAVETTLELEELVGTKANTAASYWHRRLREIEAAAAAPPLPARAELGALKLGELKRRARAAGVSGDQLGDADDADSPVEAVIDLLLGALAGGGGAAAKEDL